MGNRATVSFAGTGPAAPCVYLHWNGGRCSVEAFLDVVRSEREKTTSPGAHIAPIAARDAFARAALAFIGSSVYVGRYDACDTDNHDNGTYVVDSNLDITDRLFMRNCQEENDDVKRAAIVGETLAKARVMGEEAYRAQLVPAA